MSAEPELPAQVLINLAENHTVEELIEWLWRRMTPEERAEQLRLAAL